MSEEPKSLLDGIPVEDKAFPLKHHHLSGPTLSIVGSCIHCGSPIYGKGSVQEGEEPKSVFSCNCYRPSRNVQQKFLEIKEEGMPREGK